MNAQQFSGDLTAKNTDLLAALRSKFAGIASDVTLSRFDWRVLMESGALASLHVSRYRGVVALAAGDLGLDSDDLDKVASIVDLGQRLLLPKEVLGKFNSLETRARQVLRGYCLKTPAGLFLPAAAYTPAAAAMQQYRDKFFDLVDDLVARLETHKITMQSEYYTLANQVKQRLIRDNILSYSDGLDFTDRFVERCMQQYPTLETIRASFDFALRLEFVPLPYQMAQQETPDFATASSDVIAMRRAVIRDQQTARSEIVNGFVSSIQQELYGLVNQALGDVLASVQTNGNLQSRSVVQLRGLVDKLSQLNFWQDRRLETIQQEIMALLDRPGNAKRDLALDTDVLGELRTQARIMLAQLGSGSNRGDLDLTVETPAITLGKSSSRDDLDLAAPAASANGVTRDGDKVVSRQGNTELVFEDGKLTFRRLDQQETPAVETVDSDITWQETLTPAAPGQIETMREYLTPASIKDDQIVWTRPAPAVETVGSGKRGKRLF